MKSFLAICTAALALPMLAQTTTTTTTTTTTKTHHAMKASSGTKTRVLNDATRLAALLQDAQTTDNVDTNTWKVVANEANALANRLYGYTGGNSTARAAARDARAQVRQFRDAAMAGDAASARSHATDAMQSVTKLIDWAS